MLEAFEAFHSTAGVIVREIRGLLQTSNLID